MAETEYEGFAVLELMGRRRLGGYVRQVELFGVPMCRLDVLGPEPGSVTATQYYGGNSIYCLTPTTEAMARAVALRNQPEPVQRWELPAPKAEPDDMAPQNRRCADCDRAIYGGGHGLNGRLCGACAEEWGDDDEPDGEGIHTGEEEGSAHR